MQLDITDLNAYIDLANCRASWDDCIRLNVDDAFCRVCEKNLLSDINRLRLFRYYSVYRFYSQLAECGITTPIRVKLHPFKRGYAYMLDRGEVHLFSDLLFKSSHSEFIAILLHESAHVVLSQAEFYDRLLLLDMQFAEKYLKGQQNELLKAVTPVEFYAQLISYKWLSELAKRNNHQRITKILNNESKKIYSKLHSAVDLLNKINN